MILNDANNNFYMYHEFWFATFTLQLDGTFSSHEKDGTDEVDAQIDSEVTC